MGLAEFQAAVGAFPRLAVDTSPFVYQFENHPRYSAFTHWFFTALDASFRRLQDLPVILLGEYL